MLLAVLESGRALTGLFLNCAPERGVSEKVSWLGEKPTEGAGLAIFLRRGEISG